MTFIQKGYKLPRETATELSLALPDVTRDDHATRGRLRLVRGLVGDEGSHARRDALAHLDVQELVGPVRVRLGAKHTSNHELRGEELAQHAHERDGTALTHVADLLAEIGL